MKTPFRTNAWNRFRYSLYVPFYDAVGRWFTPQRREAIGKLDLKPGQRVLLVGAGTGLDLEHLPRDVEITAIDLTPPMVARIRERNRFLGRKVDARVMDGQHLELDSQSFDAVILHLILAVIPDPVACLREAERVLVPGGRVVVFDKFLPSDQRPPIWRRWTNILTFILATDINRTFEPLQKATGLELLSDEPAGWKGNLRIILLAKPAG